MEILKGGAFSVIRTGKIFSRAAVDLTLEQTINKSAASPSKGLVHFHNSANAINRWIFVSNQRNKAIDELDLFVNKEPCEKPHAQQSKRRDNEDRLKLQDAIKKCLIRFLMPQKLCQT